MTAALKIEETDLKFFCETIEARAGIALKSTKHELVRTRLRTRLIANNFANFSDYRDFLSSLPPDHPEWELFTNNLTTNKTDFFREAKHFDYLVEEVLPAWLKTSERFFRVWSAAASTGEEAYTLAMVLQKHIPPGRDFKILATDIDTAVLKTAQNAVYPMLKKPEIPLEYHANCLEFGSGEAAGWFRIKKHLKEKVVFKTHNLIEQQSSAREVFDLVLCRNVLIYFTKETIEVVQKKLYSATKPNGYLYIGHSESFQGLDHKWRSVLPSIFKRDAK
jgi:chemotaxis protein methyltransferase CheR